MTGNIPAHYQEVGDTCLKSLCWITLYELFLLHAGHEEALNLLQVHQNSLKSVKSLAIKFNEVWIRSVMFKYFCVNVSTFRLLMSLFFLSREGYILYWMKPCFILFFGPVGIGSLAHLTLGSLVLRNIPLFMIFRSVTKMYFGTDIQCRWKFKVGRAVS